MKNIVHKILFATVAISSSCDELIHTQKQAPRILLSTNSVAANGTDFIEIKAELDRPLSTQQKIKFTTTNGLLFPQPIFNGLSGNMDSLLVKANERIAIAYLKASQVPDPNVVVSASIGSLIGTANVTFTASCPTEILVSQFNSTINNNETIEIMMELIRGDGKKVSANQRIDCLSSPSEAVEVTPVVYSDNDGKVKITLKAIRQGDVSLSFTDKSNCKVTIAPKKITVN